MVKNRLGSEEELREFSFGEAIVGRVVNESLFRNLCQTCGMPLYADTRDGKSYEVLAKIGRETGIRHRGIRSIAVNHFGASMRGEGDFQMVHEVRATTPHPGRRSHGVAVQSQNRDPLSVVVLDACFVLCELANFIQTHLARHDDRSAALGSLNNGPGSQRQHTVKFNHEFN